MKSMTGMGKARAKLGKSYLRVELKSVNHKYCEVYTRLPQRFQSLEPLMTQLIKKTCGRGKIDLWLGEDRGSGEMELNKKALKSYHKFLKEIKSELKLNEGITLSHLQSGSSYWMTKEVDIKKEWPQIKKIVEAALEDLLKMRLREGKNLKRFVLAQVKKMEQLLSKLKAHKSQVFNKWKEKFEKRIQKILNDIEVDPGKLANEVAFYAERTDITEECDRLQSHFSQVKKLLNSSGPCGRPLDFLIQEMNREWNTIASKSQNVSIAHWVVEAKSEMEKMREQVQNIE